MTLVYPESGARSFAYNQDLSRFVDRDLSKMVSEESVFKSALLDVMWKQKETFTGDRLEWAMYRIDGLAGNTGFFNIFNSTSDAVTATEPDAYIVCKADPRNIGRKIKLSKLRLAQASGKEAKINYIRQELRARVIELSLGLDRALYTGNPGTTNASEFSGLDYTIDNGITHSLYASQTRSLSRALVGNEISATSTANAVTTQTGATVTNGSVTLEDDSRSGTVSPGDVVQVTDANGNTFWYYATTQTANDITLSSQFEGATGAVGSYKIYSIFSDTNRYGDSGELTLAKVHRTYAMACDGSETPNLGACHQFVWSELRQLVLDTEYSISKSDLNRLGTSGFENYLVLDMPITVAGNAPVSNLYMVNTNFLKLKTLKGFGSMNLTQSGLRPLSTLAGSYETLLGEIVVSGELCSSANNRHAVLTNITTA